MSKRKSETVGTIACPFCLSDAEVRQTPGKAHRFIYCPHDKVINVSGRAGGYQDYIADHMREIIEGEIVSAAPGPTPAPTTEPAASQAPETPTGTPTEPATAGAGADGFAWPWD